MVDIRNAYKILGEEYGKTTLGNGWILNKWGCKGRD
jgi:hypothetical protein